MRGPSEIIKFCSMDRLRPCARATASTAAQVRFTHRRGGVLDILLDQLSVRLTAAPNPNLFLLVSLPINGSS
ncbi:MAG: hypothetical protein PHW87_00130 [Methanothrix sp.]|nr:hypothetical protein [Methanothrix sp.]